MGLFLRRREYDRSLGDSSFGNAGMHLHPQATTTRPSHQRGSRNFWAHQHSRSRFQHPSSTPHHPHASAQQHKGNDPFQSPHVQRATGWRRTRSNVNGSGSSATSQARADSWPSQESPSGGGSSGLYGTHTNTGKARGSEAPVTQNYVGAMDVLARVGGLAMLCSLALYVASALSR